MTKALEDRLDPVRRRQQQMRGFVGAAWGLLASGCALLLITVGRWLLEWQLNAWQIAGVVPNPREHALGATAAALIFYVALHAGIGLLFLISNTLRLNAGFISPRRAVDMRLTRLWLDYTLVTGAIATGLVLALPALVAMLGGRP